MGGYYQNLPRFDPRNPLLDLSLPGQRRPEDEENELHPNSWLGRQGGLVPPMLNLSPPNQIDGGPPEPPIPPFSQAPPEPRISDQLLNEIPNQDRTSGAMGDTLPRYQDIDALRDVAAGKGDAPNLELAGWPRQLLAGLASTNKITETLSPYLAYKNLNEYRAGQQELTNRDREIAAEKEIADREQGAYSGKTYRGMVENAANQYANRGILSGANMTALAEKGIYLLTPDVNPEDIEQKMVVGDQVYYKRKEHYAAYLPAEFAREYLGIPGLDASGPIGLTQDQLIKLKAENPELYTYVTTDPYEGTATIINVNKNTGKATREQIPRDPNIPVRPQSSPISISMGPQEEYINPETLETQKGYAFDPPPPPWETKKSWDLKNTSATPTELRLAAQGVAKAGGEDINDLSARALSAYTELQRLKSGGAPSSLLDRINPRADPEGRLTEKLYGEGGYFEDLYNVLIVASSASDAGVQSDLMRKVPAELRGEFSEWMRTNGRSFPEPTRIGPQPSQYPLQPQAPQPAPAPQAIPQGPQPPVPEIPGQTSAEVEAAIQQLMRLDPTLTREEAMQYIVR
jgi:hypothetical protein